MFKYGNRILNPERVDAEKGSLRERLSIAASWAKVSQSCRWEIGRRGRKENISPSAETKHRPRIFELAPFCTVLAVG